MTKQETFETSVSGVLAQGDLSYDDEGTCSCSYRGPDGRACAAGQLIPDAEYTSEMEGEMASRPCVKGVLEAGGHNIDLVLALQDAHDNATDSAVSARERLDRFVKAARVVADDYGLDVAFLAASE